MTITVTKPEGSDNAECSKQKVDASLNLLCAAVPPRLCLSDNATVPGGWTKTWLLMCLSYFLCQLMSYVAEPLFKCKASEVCGGSDDGEVFTNIYVIRNLVQMVATPIFGWLSDRFGRKPILVSIFITALAAIIVFETATTTGGLYISSVLSGMSPVSAIYIAWIGDMVPKSFRTRYICWLLAVGAVGIGLSAFGPVVAAWCSLSVSVLASSIALGGVTLMLLIPELIPKERLGKDLSPPSSGPNILFLVLGSIMFYKLTQNIEIVTRQHVLEHHYPETYCFSGENATQASYECLIFLIQLARALANVIAGFVSNEFLVASGAIIGLGVTLLVSAFNTHMLLSSAMTVLVHALVGISNPMYFSITSQAAGSGEQGKMIGILSFCKDLSTVAAYKLGQYLWSCGSDARDSGETWAAILPALVGTVCTLAAATFLMIAYNKKRTAKSS